MSRALLVALVIAGLPLCASAQCSPTAPGTSNEAVQQPFVPPPPYKATSPSGRFWYGSPQLWTYITFDGFQTGDSSRLSAKLVYWRVGFDWLKEPDPDLEVVAKRLDNPAPLVRAGPAHAVKFPNDDSPASMAMMTGIRIPAAGCWEITANYRGQTLSYVVSVRP